jgi:hypothetical protein
MSRIAAKAEASSLMRNSVLVFIAGTFALHAFSADDQTLGRKGEGKEQDLRNAREVIEKYRTGTTSYKDFKSAVKTISVATNRQMVCAVLVGAIDLGDPIEDDETATQLDTRFPAVSALIDMGDLCVSSLFTEIKNPRTASSRYLAEYVLVVVLGLERAVVLAEKESWHGEKERTNLNETLMKWKTGRVKQSGTNATGGK